MLALKQHNHVIIFRSVTPGTQQLIDQKHPTKNFHIKGKSAVTGPVRHFIPVDQAHSKLAGMPKDKIDKANAQVRKCLGTLYAAIGKSRLSREELKQYLLCKSVRLSGVKVPRLGKKSIVDLMVIVGEGVSKKVRLVWSAKCDMWCDTSARAYEGQLGLSQSRFKDLIHEGHMHVVLPDSEGSHVVGLVSGGAAPGQPAEFIARRRLGGHYDIFYADGKRPVYVLHDTHLFKALVPDYDLHEIMPHISEYGPLDLLPYSPITLKQHSKISRQHNMTTKKIEQLEHPKTGNTTRRIRIMIRRLNAAFGRGPGLNTVHHNIDAASPYAKLDYPLTVIFPRKIAGFPSVMLVCNESELVAVMQESVNHGYVMRHNHNFGKKIMKIRRDSFRRSHARVNLASIFGCKRQPERAVEFFVKAVESEKAKLQIGPPSIT